MPKVANYTDHKISLFLKKPQLNHAKFNEFFNNFCKTNPGYEIEIFIIRNDLIEVCIGSKISCFKNIQGVSVGHNHPNLNVLKERSDLLPSIVMARFLPSPGDLKCFIKYSNYQKGGIKIFSEFGHSLIKFSIDTADKLQTNINDYENKYFDLFLGNNKFDFNSDEKFIEYFKNVLGLELEIYYDKREKSKTKK